MKLPHFVYNYRRYFFPFFGAPCCEKMAEWLTIEAFYRFSHLALAHHSTQTDLLIIVGRISHKQAPVLQHFYSNMLYPNSVLHLKGCTTHTIGYASMHNLEQLIPIQHALESCPLSLKDIETALINLNNQSSVHL